jgi:hypothetical protein
MSLGVLIAVPLGAFAAVTALALAAGAPGLGEAATFGALAYAVVLVAVLVRDPVRSR